MKKFFLVSFLLTGLFAFSLNAGNSAKAEFPTMQDCTVSCEWTYVSASGYTCTVGYYATASTCAEAQQRLNAMLGQVRSLQY